jgi:hypothetical protein
MRDLTAARQTCITRATVSSAAAYEHGRQLQIAADGQLTSRQQAGAQPAAPEEVKASSNSRRRSAGAAVLTRNGGSTSTVIAVAERPAVRLTYVYHQLLIAKAALRRSAC